jgi:hypothetical protein
VENDPHGVTRPDPGGLDDVGAGSDETVVGDDEAGA